MSTNKIYQQDRFSVQRPRQIRENESEA